MKKQTRKIIRHYYNGNYAVILFSDGTKVRRLFKGNEYKPSFPESMDVCISHKCNGGCPFCYDGANTRGKHAVLLDKNGEFAQEWMKCLHAGQELALNGNDLSNPYLKPFLEKLKTDVGCIVNITVHKKHFMEHVDTLIEWQNDGLIYGVGISMNEMFDTEKETEQFLTNSQKLDNVVIHTVAGIVKPDVFKFLCENNMRILVLGFKELGRAVHYLTNSVNKGWRNIHSDGLKGIIPRLKKRMENNEPNSPSALSFDCLAVEQLGVKDMLTQNENDKFYMGDDGTTTFYIDAVHGYYAKSSTELKQKFSSKDKTIPDMFEHIRSL